ncbi:MAG: hypothetical protein ABIG20_03520 [archaeon]
MRRKAVNLSSSFAFIHNETPETVKNNIAGDSLCSKLMKAVRH